MHVRPDPLADRLRNLPGNAAEIELAKARAQLEEKLMVLTYVEYELDGTTSPAAPKPLWEIDPALPAKPEAVLAGALVASVLETDAAIQDWADAALEREQLYDELQGAFTGQRAEWHPLKDPVKTSASAFAAVSSTVLRACAELIQRICCVPPPPEAEMRRYLSLLRGHGGAELKGPLCLAKKRGAPRRILVLVPAARVLREHGKQIAAWMRRSAGSTPTPPDDATRLAQALAEAQAARNAASKARSQLKGLQEAITSEVNRRVDLRVENYEARVRAPASPSRRALLALAPHRSPSQSLALMIC